MKNKGLNAALSEDEIYYVLLYSLKHRGISYLDEADDGNLSSDYARSIARNEEELKENFPCQIQLERLQRYGAYRGNITIIEDGEPVTLRNVFTTSAYRSEIEKFLEVQKGFNTRISEEFIAEYLEIFNRKRAYYIGPGNELSRTDYGVYTTVLNEDGTYITEKNLFDKLIGKCSVYPEEKRAAGASYTAQEFNVLNDLNNLKIISDSKYVEDGKLTEEAKRIIVDNIKTAKAVNVPKIIKDVINDKDAQINGARIDKNEKEIFHSFEVYNKMRRAFETIDVDITKYQRETLDKLGDILTLNTDKDSITEAARELELSDEVLECLIKLRRNNSSLFNKWQSFGYRIMLELLPELYSQPKNQMQLLTDMGVFKTKPERFAEYDTIPADVITEEIYNPVAAKTIRITVKILNALIKKYGYPEQIVIEMPRDKNTDEEKARINKEQKNNENELKNIKAKIKSEYGRDITDADFKQHKNLSLKLKLWNEQGGVCPYSGKTIRIDELIDNSNLFEIDHIIPLSISFDDSRSNKVLVYASENQNKGNRTPYAYLTNVNRDWDFYNYMDFVLKNYKDATKRKKKENLLFEEDITKIEVLSGFVNRNINDTRYASRVVLNSLQDYFRAKDCGTKVKVVRGSFTHQMRMNLKLNKDRDESYVHHAVDAMLIAFSQMGYDSWRKLTEQFIDYENEEYINKSGFEKLLSSDEAYKNALYQSKWMKIKANIENAAEKNKYWYQVNKKCNRELCNQTIYGTREYDGKAYKISKLDIRTDDGVKKFKGIVEKKPERLLVCKNDPKTFEILMDIWNNYKDAKNPFLQYEQENNDVIRKYSKKGNGPKVGVLKYEDGEVGSCIDISHKYGYERGSRKVILDSLNPYRMDVYYKTDEEKYYFVGVKQSDIKCDGDLFVIDEQKYAEALLAEKMIAKGQCRGDLQELGYEYKLSFYKEDIIEYEKDGEVNTERFLSRTMPKVRNYIETKPLNAAKFEKQNLVGLSKTKSVKKIVTDILGNKFYVDKMKFSIVVGKQ
ncbi:type II CRISPR RNA-guided endonuclease Cas9 [Pseudobutyrivibrio sp.]|uniref:type II CRISPR RNA-guided endonuclease Cas9 n=1 Tax=Pseudobutyrivibrio sp. TaxID=2014367 RepID=UPI0025ED4E18|nr:type II CRISPR RNA-guided endonuclease Cas9 [Pseudobutyrivibrio sp.]